jgi:hypothetical protein
VARVLITGWFSFEEAEVTAGDLLARDTLRSWLAAEGVAHEVAVASAFRQPGEVDVGAADPLSYTHLIFVCGPAAGKPVERLMERFSRCRRLGVGVSVVDGTPNVGLDDILARDSPRRNRPDLSLVSRGTPAPVVGIIRGHAQPEYGDRHRLSAAHDAIDALVMRVGVAPVPIDTWLHPGRADLASTPGQVESILARMDAVVTTRLHGLVLALKVGVPALAVDPVAGGGKIARQAAALGWPAVLTVDQLDQPSLAERLAWCLTGAARTAAVRAAEEGRARLEAVRRDLIRRLAA